MILRYIYLFQTHFQTSQSLHWSTDEWIVYQHRELDNLNSNYQKLKPKMLKSLRLNA